MRVESPKSPAVKLLYGEWQLPTRQRASAGTGRWGERAARLPRDSSTSVVALGPIPVICNVTSSSLSAVRKWILFGW